VGWFGNKQSHRARHSAHRHSRIFVLAQAMTHKHSEYMHWAKTQSKAPYNLATSGVGPFPLRELPFDWAGIEINGNNAYGFPPLKAAIGRKYGVEPECIVTAEGTSMANYLAMATILDPGDEVLIEHPAYGLIADAARHIGANVTHFARREENGWAVDPAEIRRAISAKTKLVVVTNPHNPSSVLAPDAALREAADVAASVGATLLVDEVYLDAVYENTPRSSFHLAPNVVVTSSLTKVYGVSGLRCGWIFAQPDLARRMWQLNNLFAATAVHPSEIVSVAAFEHLDILRDRARRIVEADRAALAPFLDLHPHLAAVRTNFGTTCFIRLKSGKADEFLTRLRAEQETSAVPGRFFGAPDHFRIGMGANHEMFVEGLRRIGLALA
jgi:aspartate/methionine/tyrosine aminotransferase